MAHPPALGTQTQLLMHNGIERVLPNTLKCHVNGEWVGRLPVVSLPGARSG